MPVPLTVLLLVLAVCSLTYLLVESALPLIAVPRNFLIRWLDPRDELGVKTAESPLGGFGRAVGYLMGCPWCTSAWVALAVVYLTQTYTSVPLPWLVVAAAHYLTGALSDARGWGEERYRLNRAQVFAKHEELKKAGFRLPPQWEE